VSKRLNLANKPFTNRALPWVVTTVLVFFSLIVLTFIVRATSQANAQAKLVQSSITSLNEDERLLQRKRAEEVQNALTLEQVQALKSAHELVDRKRFSWTRLFGDLEAVLPDGVRVTRIAVRHVAAHGGRTVADLELTVVAKTPTIVTDMIAEMDRGGTFQAELRSQSLEKGKGETGAEYELNVQYSPRGRFASSTDENARAAVERSTTGSTGGPR
jgi:Tfp pilus assembly protein PilN